MASPARILVVDDSSTILKVVSAILTRHGYEAAVARDGTIGIDMIKRGDPFDLVLLDFVMPRMNGYQFCRELRSMPEHKSLPVVLMSAKGDKIRGQFVKQTGAVDAITKPFDARALVAVIQGALSKSAEGRARPVPEGEAMPDEESVAPESMAPRSLLSGKHQKQQASLDLAQHVAAAVAPAILGLTPAERGVEPSVTAAIVRSFTPDVVSSLAMLLKELEPEERAKEVMSGDIGAVALAEILQILQMQRQTGVLRVLNNRTTVAICIRQGLIDLVQGRGASDEYRLGRYFIERGLVTRDQIEAVARSRPPGQLIGEALVAAGLASQDDLVDALSRQSSELTYDVLRWSFGRFAFTREGFSAEAEAAKLGLGISGLVLEGFRRVDEWRLMEGTLNFDQVVVVDQVMLDGVGSGKLTRSEQLVLGAVDGARTVNEVVKESAVGSFDALKIIYQFLQSRVLRTRAA
ncbi:MAG TPA: response regulator [Polyangiaceae bacterium]|nr:response regulator [Polyangiaceae bacterium]